MVVGDDRHKSVSQCLRSREMDRIEASEPSAIECGRRVKQNVVEANERKSPEYLARSRDCGFAVRTNCTDDLDACQRTRDASRMVAQIARQRT